MAHAHSPGAGDGRRANRRRLALVLGLVTAYMVAEIVGGLLSNSLALLADAGHMFSDAAALGLALFALWFAARPAPPRRTYGYYRVEILAAFVNGATLVAIALFIVAEAWQRLREPPEIQGGLMMAVAAGGFAVNVVSLWLLHGGREESLNVRGAWLHVWTDLLGSVQVLAAGGLILAFGWTWVDPLASVLIALLVLYSSWGVVSASVSVLMESAPGHIDIDAVRNALRALPGVLEVHDLHVWTITSGRVALSAHVIADDRRPGLLAEARRTLSRRFGITHTTIQVERDPTDNCPGGC